jgi:hypothetical protein
VISADYSSAPLFGCLFLFTLQVVHPGPYLLQLFTDRLSLVSEGIKLLLGTYWRAERRIPENKRRCGILWVCALASSISRAGRI